MDNFKTYGRFTSKYRLLYCLLLNYYRSYYANNKFKSKILVLGKDKKELMECYDEIYSTIREFKVEDLFTLRKFISWTDKQLKQLFANLDNEGISFAKIIEDIKSEYIPSKSEYKKYKVGESEWSLKPNKNLAFIETSDATNITNKHLVREIFIPTPFTLADLKDGKSILGYILYTYAKEILKTKSILKNNNAHETDFLSLSIFINSNAGLDLEDKINDYLDNEEDFDEE